MRNKLTSTIAEMIDAIDKYMGKRVSGNPYLYTFNDKGEKCYIEALFDWNSLHKVWEKMREEIIYIREADEYYLECSYQISEGTPLDTLTALYNCIIFINQLKEQENV